MNPNPSIRTVCLDFDGTILSYDEAMGFVHPTVVDLLNRLPDRDLQWWTNSGRDFADQLAVLEASRLRGLRHLPTVMMCSESTLYLRQGDGYRPHNEWNRFVHELLHAFHEDVQKLIRPRLADWVHRYQPRHVSMWKMGTAMFVEEEDDRPARLRDEFREALGALPDAVADANGGWVFVQHTKLGKGNVLRCCLEHFAWPGEHVLAIGDNYNDLDMLDGSVTPHVGCPADSVPDVISVVTRAGGKVATADGPLGTCEVIRAYLDGR